MKQNNYGEMILCQEDLFDLLMQGRDITTITNAVIDHSINLKVLSELSNSNDFLSTWQSETMSGGSTEEFDNINQSTWFMPEQYKSLDIASYVLSLCKSEAELQRVGQELLLYQEKNQFELLQYLKYLVDTMKENGIVWGVGRGSSVASYVLYLLEIHKVDSIFYDLDPTEFLR